MTEKPRGWSVSWLTLGGARRWRSRTGFFMGPPSGKRDELLWNRERMRRPLPRAPIYGHPKKNTNTRRRISVRGIRWGERGRGRKIHNTLVTNCVPPRSRSLGVAMRGRHEKPLRGSGARVCFPPPLLPEPTSHSSREGDWGKKKEANASIFLHSLQGETSGEAGKMQKRARRDELRFFSWTFRVYSWNYRAQIHCG